MSLSRIWRASRFWLSCWSSKFRARRAAEVSSLPSCACARRYSALGDAGCAASTKVHASRAK